MTLPQKAFRWREGLQVMGPAFLVSVAYLDPGNWATAIESGSRFGYSQLWLLVLSNLIAIHLQALASRLGLATSKHLAQVCRDSYPRSICVMLWVMTEVSIVALDLTMVLGTAIGLNLLFKIPHVTCILLTGVDALAHLLLLPQAGLRHAQQWTATLVAAVLACFVVDLFISRPPLQAVVSGLLPSLHREGIYSAVSLLGANIMPHNFYLHSALVATQARPRDAAHTARLCYLNFVDIACALGLALLVNVAVLLVAASTFHATGVTVATLQDAHDLLEQILNSRLAPLAFGLALLLTGQMSTFTGTIAGQVVLSGFMGVQSSTLARRLGTRALAIVPALVVQIAYGAPGTYKMLVLAQVVLALQLPFTLIPLIKATSSRALMGAFASSWLRSGVAWAASFIVFAANLLMVLDMLRMDAPEPRGAAGLTEWSISGGFQQWLQHVSRSFARAPRQFVALSLVTVVAGGAVMLLSWMLVCPVHVSDAAQSGTGGTASTGKHSPPTDEPRSPFPRSWDLEEGGPNEPGPHGSTACADERHAAERCTHVASQHVQAQAKCNLSSLKRSPVTSRSAQVTHCSWRLAGRVWEAVLMGRWKLPTQQRSAGQPQLQSALQALPLTQARLSAHNQASPGSHARDVLAQQHAAHAAAAHVANVPPPLLDWRSAEARRARWLLTQQQLSRSASETDLSLAAEPSIDRSIASSQMTVPGGMKGHSMGRSSRRQFARLLAAVWLQHYDKFGFPVATAQACSGAEAIVDVCDTVAEVKLIAGSDSLLREWSAGIDSSCTEAQRGAPTCTQRSSEASSSDTRSDTASQWDFDWAPAAQARPSSDGSHILASTLCNAEQPVMPATGALHVGNSFVPSVRPGTLPQLGNTLCAHANAVYAFAQCAAAIRPVAAAAQRRTDWPAELVQSDAWQRVLVMQQAAWQQPRSALSTTQQAQAQQGAASADALRLSFGIWCISALLLLGAVEPRPELWGKYVAALNPLQGVLRAVSDCSGPGHDREHSRSPRGSPVGRRTTGLGSVFDDLADLLIVVERHVRACGGRGSCGGTAAAFAKGKENLLSVVKRYKALLRPCSDPGEGPASVASTVTPSTTWHVRKPAAAGVELSEVAESSRTTLARSRADSNASASHHKVDEDPKRALDRRKSGQSEAAWQRLGGSHGRKGLQSRADRGSWRE